jgi:hypothetical protein
MVIPIICYRGVDGVGQSAQRSGRFTPEKQTRYPLWRRLDGPQNAYTEISFTKTGVRILWSSSP